MALQKTRAYIYCLTTRIISTATTVQTWRISSLKSRLRTVFQGSAQTTPSIMLYTKPLLYTNEEFNNISQPANTNGAIEYFMSSHLCCNNALAKLGDLLWSQNSTILCSIYPQQKVDLSEWLICQSGGTLLPLFTNSYTKTSQCQDFKMHALIEADFETYRPLVSTMVMKLEDYGLIIGWMANKSLNIVIETNLDLITKLAITVMQGQRYINNGFLLTRILSVLVTGYPCFYNGKHLNCPPDQKVEEKKQWEKYVEKLKLLSTNARLVAQQKIQLEVTEIPELIIFPGSEFFTLDIPTDSESQIAEGKSLRSTPTLSESVESFITNETKSIHAENITNVEDIDPINNQNISDSHPVPLSSETMEKTLDNNKLKEENGSGELPQKAEKIEICFDSKLEISPKSVQLNSSKETTIFYTKQYSKPPNVLIYSESAVALSNMKNVLETVLDADSYIVCTLSREDARSDIWMDQAGLVVVCGNVGSDVGNQLIEYIVRGGKLLALCSDTLHILLPSFKTAEVREHELVHFSYGKWKHVRMMHHIFCYQASPVRTRFSHDNEDTNVPTLHPPVSATVKDKVGKEHSFHIKVLGTEETWHTPSIILATLPSSVGTAVFSQIHLEADPVQYECEENKFNALKQSNTARLEIFNDLLSVHLKMELKKDTQKFAGYTPAFFLGKHETISEMLEKLKPKLQANDVLKMSKLSIQFCKKNMEVESASDSFLPIMVHQCPDNFSTVEYFENLKTKDLGRLVIYADVLTSSMDVVNNYKFQHGLVVIPRQQTHGRGRSKNVWLSPKGSAMFTLHLHIPKNSYLGSHVSIIQHVSVVAVVSAIKSIPGYESIDLRLKWPNDIYAGKSTKLGGVIVQSQVESSLVVCNVGLGLNLSNSLPTICINDMINEYNTANKQKLQPILYERYFALVFNEFEKLIDIIQTGNMNYFLENYYKYWLHTDAEVTVISVNGQSECVKITGVDEFGFLKVQSNGGKTFSVQPDGNSFDLLKGLITPK